MAHGFNPEKPKRQIRNIKKFTLLEFIKYLSRKDFARKLIGLCIYKKQAYCLQLKVNPGIPACAGHVRGALTRVVSG